MERGRSAVEWWPLNRGYHFKTWPFSLSPRRPSSFSCISEYLAKDSTGFISHRRTVVVILGANIFLTSDGPLKLGDFGSAVKLKNHTTMPGEVNNLVGTAGECSLRIPSLQSQHTVSHACVLSV